MSVVSKQRCTNLIAKSGKKSIIILTVFNMNKLNLFSEQDMHYLLFKIKIFEKKSHIRNFFMIFYFYYKVYCNWF